MTNTMVFSSTKDISVSSKSVHCRATGNFAKFPTGIPGNFGKIAIGYVFPVISLFVQFHYHLQQTLSVNYNVLSIKLPTVKVKKKRKIGLHV